MSDNRKAVNEEQRKATLRPNTSNSTPKINPPSGGSNVTQQGTGQASQTNTGTGTSPSTDSKK